MELRWLTAPEHEVAAAMADERRSGRPKRVPTGRRVLFHLYFSLVLWYLAIALVSVGVSVDEYHDRRVEPDDVIGLVVAALVLVGLLVGAWFLYRWSRRPPSPKARLAGWRTHLTAVANGLEEESKGRAMFSSLITTTGKYNNAFITVPGPQVQSYPRFVRGNIEFGNLVDDVKRSRDWHYLVVRLPAPLPHLLLDATTNDTVRSDLPPGVDRGLQISLEGDFDRWFRVYAPSGYGADARYVLTPDVMSSLVSTAAYYNVEMVDDRVVFFSRPAADFAYAAPWVAIDAILTDLVPRLITRAERYRDERVAGQDAESVLEAARDAMEAEQVWTRKETVVGEEGRRLTVRARFHAIWVAVGAVSWLVTRTLLYFIPAAFAFAGFMSVVDGR
ncbi:hypothetical protein ACQ3HE_08975 [Plantibacter auratus]|uniref:hypothetical protein n=1 Tax=Plantibacter auratus TaxID=272914 RepID=UPI003D3347A8